MDGDVQVAEVEDARGVLRHLKKNADARWVAGLTNDDDEIPVQTPTPDPNTPRGKWLAVHATLLILVAASYHIHFEATSLSYLTNEVASWPALRRLSSSSLMARTAGLIINATILALLSLQLAKASELFFNFIAFGMACVSALFAIGDAILLFGACTWFSTPQNECFLPLILHWICAATAEFGPVVALLANVCAISSIPTVVTASNWPKFATIGVAALPLIVLGARIGWACYVVDPSMAVQGTSEAKTIASLSTLFIAWRLNRVPKFQVAVTKEHNE